MNKIELPSVEDIPIDDWLIIFNLARNSRSGSFPWILYEEAEIIEGYNKYVAAGGDPHLITPSGLTCASKIKDLYESTCKKSAPSDVKHLRSLRSVNSDKCCPMCGSFGRGTLDHVLPKANYPEFSIFSLNLVPACNCNSLRQNEFAGALNTERVVHPYFDTGLSQRVLKVIITPPFDCPGIDIGVALPAQAPLYNAVKFHLNKVVKPTAILSHMSNRWIKLVGDPWLILPTLPRQKAALGRASIRLAIQAEISRLDSLFESKNNWDSLFVDGLLADEIYDYVLAIALSK